MKGKFLIYCFQILVVGVAMAKNSDILVPEGFGIDFYDSMPKDSDIDSLKATKSVYDKYVINNFSYSVSPRIPKIIHQIWLGSPFPEGYRYFQNTWIENHPDWKYILWTEQEIEEFGLVNKKLYDNARNYGEKSDIARCEILYRMGGLYVDTDFECLRSFDIFNHGFDFYIGLYSKTSMVNNALIGSAPGHPILRECIDRLADNKHDFQKAVDTLFTTGPYFVSKCVAKHMLSSISGRCVAFPVGYFYPLSPKERGSTPEQIKKKICPETFAIHYWDVAWNGGVVPTN